MPRRTRLHCNAAHNPTRTLRQLSDAFDNLIESGDDLTGGAARHDDRQLACAASHVVRAVEYVHQASEALTTAVRS